MTEVSTLTPFISVTIVVSVQDVTKKMQEELSTRLTKAQGVLLALLFGQLASAQREEKNETTLELTHIVEANKELEEELIVVLRNFRERKWSLLDSLTLMSIKTYCNRNSRWALIIISKLVKYSLLDAEFLGFSNVPALLFDEDDDECNTN